MTKKCATTRIFILLFAIATLSVRPSLSASREEEERLGRQYAARFEKEVTLADDERLISRVQLVGSVIAEVANTHEVPASYGSSGITEFAYRFRVIEDEDVNAVSLPGGYIYVNSGLLELATTDDELAGVVAHEVAHAAHHHATYLMKKGGSVDRCVAVAAIAGILGKVRASDLSNILMGAKMLRSGKLSSYTQEAENDADRTAVAYLVRSGYDPVALLTFLKKLEAESASKPSLSLGIYQTHPPHFARAASILAAMRELGIQTDLRELLGRVSAVALPVEGASDRYRVAVCNRMVCETTSIAGGGSARERAEAAAEAINSFLSDNPSARDIGLDSSSNSLVVRDHRLLTVEAEDLTTGCNTYSAVLDRARNALEYAVWAEWLYAASHRTGY